MLDKFYPIGQFAAMNKVSARMLRHYDKIGLLKPATINENGYRLYGSSQISTIALIKKYRSCEFSLTEINALLMGESKLSQAAKQKIKELKGQEATHADALTRLYELSGENKMICFDNPYEISLTAKNSQLLCVGAFCNEGKIENEFSYLYHYLETANLQPMGLSMLLCNLSLKNRYRVAVPVKGRTRTEKYTFESLEIGQYLSTFHYGDYCQIAAAYDKLLLHIEQNGLKSDNTFLERYFLDSSHTTQPAEYITEISIKITP